LAHSAGGLVARHFVESSPNDGVTRVIQVATPNGGAYLAELGARVPKMVPREQKPFVMSVAPAYRANLLRSRQQLPIPTSTDFVAVVALAARGTKGDTAVN